MFEVNQSELNEFILSFDMEEWSKNEEKLSLYQINNYGTTDHSDWSSDQNSPEKFDDWDVLKSKTLLRHQSLEFSRKREVIQLKQQLSFDDVDKKSHLLRVFNMN